jgi:putative oxidoreductase
MWNTRPAAGLLWAAVPALMLGSGRFGLDCLLAKPRRQKML